MRVLQRRKTSTFAFFKCPFFSFYFCVFCAQNREKLDRKTRKNLSKEEDKEEDKEEKPKRTLTFLGEIKGESRVV